MFPVEIKLRLSKTGQITPEQINRLLKSRPIIFHFLTFLWHILLNYQTIAGALFLLFYRMDLVKKTCGFGIQYITIWNQVIEQTYFNASLLQDILEFTPPHKYEKIKFYLKKVLPYAFTSIVFPMSVLVTLAFWGFYSYYPQIIDEYNVTESYFPAWVNHGLHTTIFLLTLIEKTIVYRPYNSRIWCFIGLCSVILLYCITCTILYVVGGVWPYPLISIMSVWQRIAYFICVCIFGYFILRFGEALNHKIWGEQPKPALKDSKEKST